MDDHTVQTFMETLIGRWPKRVWIKWGPHKLLVDQVRVKDGEATATGEEEFGGVCQWNPFLGAVQCSH